MFGSAINRASQERAPLPEDRDGSRPIPGAAKAPIIPIAQLPHIVSAPARDRAATSNGTGVSSSHGHTHRITEPDGWLRFAARSPFLPVAQLSPVVLAKTQDLSGRRHSASGGSTR